MMWVGAMMDSCQKRKVMCGGSCEKQKSLKFGGKRNGGYWREKCEAVVCERDLRAGQIVRERLSGMKGMLNIFQATARVEHSKRKEKRDCSSIVCCFCCCVDMYRLIYTYCTCEHVLVWL